MHSKVAKWVALALLVVLMSAAATSGTADEPQAEPSSITCGDVADCTLPGPAVEVINHGAGAAIRGRSVSARIGVLGIGQPGVRGKSGNGTGVEATSTNGYGLKATSTNSDAIYVASAGDVGVHVASAGGSGFVISNAGGTGVTVGYVGGDGVLVGGATTNGLHIINTGQHGVYVESAGENGFVISNAGGTGVTIGYVGGDGVLVGGAANDGLNVTSAGRHGLNVGNADYYGVKAVGVVAGGYFEDSTSNVMTMLAYGDIGLLSNGPKNFVQPHPADTSKAIFYACLEGGEAGTYHRGSAQLEGGTAVIELPAHFAMVTEEEGLTVQVTPREDCNGLYVAEATVTRIVVKELQGGTSNARFDFFINGIRAGYGDYQVIRDAPEALVERDSTSAAPGSGE